MEDLISVILPVYNVEGRYPGALEDCLSSIQNQSYKNIEVIMVDDGSTDASGEVCDRFANEDSRFKAFHTENQGISAARNYGIDKCKGDFVFFSDADDLVHPQCLEKLHELLVMHPDLDIVIGKRQIEDNGFVLIDNLSYNIKSRDEIIKYILSTGKLSAVWNKLMRRHLVDEIKFRQTEYEDLDFMLRVYLNVTAVIVLNAITYTWVQRDASVSHHMLERRYVGILQTLKYSYVHDIKDDFPQYRGYFLGHTYSYYINNIKNSSTSVSTATMQQVEAEMKSIVDLTWKDFKTSDYPKYKKVAYYIFLHFPRLKKVYDKALFSIRQLKK